MPYEFLEDWATADVSFEARGKDLEELFTSAWDATLNTMVSEIETIQPEVEIHVSLAEEALDLLLVDFLQEQIFYKDSERLLLRVGRIQIRRQEEEWDLEADLAGQVLDRNRHEERADVKAVTLHGLVVEERDQGWYARVLLDV